jgi:2-polyprenyl-6-methoxyphenol hydroxylase-like FAD-dependent oxidoreductase
MTRQTRTTDGLQHADDGEYDVIVVGAGPVGLWLAGELRLAGVATLVLERNERPSPHSKALGIHSRTIEVLAMRGLEEQVLEAGTPLPSFHFGMLDARLDFSSLDTPYPFVLAFSQNRTEVLLERRATDLGADVLRGHTVTGLTQDDASVTVTVAGPDGGYTRQAPFVVGCDGAGSVVRKAAGIDFPGSDATVFGYLGDVSLDKPPEESFLALSNADGALIVVPVPGGRYRITGVDPAHQEPGDTLTMARLRAATVRMTGTDFGMRDPVWLSRFGNATRHATTYRQGRVLLAGDAAHMNFPAGGVGLNVGIQDAMNLGWKLAAEVQGRASANLLDTYHRERHPVGAALAEHTQAQTALITAALSPEGQALRALLNQLIGTQPQLSRALAEKLSGLDVAYPSKDREAHPLIGARAPAEDAPGLFKLLHRGRPALLTVAGTAPAAAAEHASSLGVEAHVGALPSTGGRAWPGVTAAIVRPDGHIWWATDRPSTDLASAVTEALAALPATFDRRPR